MSARVKGDIFAVWVLVWAVSAGLLNWGFHEYEAGGEGVVIATLAAGVYGWVRVKWGSGKAGA